MTLRVKKIDCSVPRGGVDEVERVCGGGAAPKEAGLAPKCESHVPSLLGMSPQKIAGLLASRSRVAEIC